jgi:hypothetical protein
MGISTSHFFMRWDSDIFTDCQIWLWELILGENRYDSKILLYFLGLGWKG